MNTYQVTVITTAFLVATQADSINPGNGVNFKAFSTLNRAKNDKDGVGYVCS